MAKKNQKSEANKVHTGAKTLLVFFNTNSSKEGMLIIEKMIANKSGMML